MLKLLFTLTINKGHPLYLIPSCNQKQMHHVFLIPKSYEVTSEGHHKMTNQTLIDYINELLSHSGGSPRTTMQQQQENHSSNNVQRKV